MMCSALYFMENKIEKGAPQIDWLVIRQRVHLRLEIFHILKYHFMVGEALCLTNYTLA